MKSLNSMCTELNIPLARRVSPNSACTELSTPLEQGEGGRREGRWWASLNSTCNVLILSLALAVGRVNLNRTEDITLVRIVSLNGRVCICN